MIKDMPTFYTANPEFRKKAHAANSEVEEMQTTEKTDKKSKIVAEVQSVEQKQEAQARAQKIIESGGELNALDVKQVDIDSQEIADAIVQMNAFLSNGEPTCDDIL